MTYSEGLDIARERGMAGEFTAAYRQYKPWWAFWISQEDAVWDALFDNDLLPGCVDDD